MEIQDGRGLHTKKIESENIKKVKDFFKKNPNSTQTECSEETGLSLVTIRKHVRNLMANS